MSWGWIVFSDAISAKMGDDLYGCAEPVWFGQAELVGVVPQEIQLVVGECQFRLAVGHLVTEQGHHHDAPGDDCVDCDRPMQPVCGPELQELGAATGFKHAEKVLDLPSLEIEAHDPGRIFCTANVERGQQIPLNRVLAVGRRGLNDVDRGHFRRLRILGGPRCRNRHAADAHFAAGQSLSAAGSGSQFFNLHVDQAVCRAADLGGQILSVLAAFTIMVHSRQQVHPGMSALSVEDLKAIRLQIAHCDYACSAVHLSGCLGDVGEAVEQPPGTPTGSDLRRAGFRRVKAQPQHAERKARIRHRQRRVQP